MSLSTALLCLRCHTPLAASSASCEACGEPTPAICPSCGRPNRTTARFCGGCGVALGRREVQPSAPQLEPSPAGKPVPLPSAPAHETPAPPPIPRRPTLVLAASIALAVIAQTVLLRTHSALPAIPLFVLSCLGGGWATFSMPAPR